MEINKTKLSSYTPEQLAQKGNFKIECTGDECYVIDIDSEDTEASITLENSNNEEETKKTKKTRLSSYTPEQLAQKGDVIIECTGDECYVIEPDDTAEETASTEEAAKGTEEINNSETTTDKTSAENESDTSEATTVTNKNTTTTKEKTDIIKITKDSGTDELRNTKGTTFVVVGGTSCGRCKKFDKILDTLNDNINDKATIAQMTLPDNCSSKDSVYKLYKELKTESKASNGTHGYPIIIKMVDGKATDFYEYKDYSGIYTNADKMTEWLENKIEKTDSNSDTTKTQKDSSTDTTKSTSETKSTKKKEITKLTKKNLKEEVRNKKGTTYVIVGGDACGICKTFEPKAKNIANELSDEANFVSITLPSKYNSDDYSAFTTLANETKNYKSGQSYGYPIIIKCVDGKATEFYSRSDIPYGNESKMKKWFQSNIEGTIEKEAETKDTEEDCTDGSCEVKVESTEATTSSDTTKSTETKETSETTKTDSANNTDSSKNSLTTEEDEANALLTFISEVKSASSIGALKNLLFQTGGMNINTQLKAMDAINGILYTDDLQEAKTTIIKAVK